MKVMHGLKETIGALQNYVNNGGGLVRIQSRSEPGIPVPSMITDIGKA